MCENERPSSENVNGGYVQIGRFGVPPESSSGRKKIDRFRLPFGEDREDEITNPEEPENK